MEKRKTDVKEVKQRGQVMNKEFDKLKKRQMQEDNLQSFIFMAIQDSQELSIEEKEQVKSCDPMDFWNIVDINVLDIDAENENFISSDYINDNTMILKYNNRIIKISK